MPRQFKGFTGPKIHVRYEYTPAERDLIPHLVEAYHEDKAIGHLEWHENTGRILGVEVLPEYRRLGVATGMLHEALRVSRANRLPIPKHSDDRSDKGDAWARAVGGPLPRRKRDQ